MLTAQEAGEILGISARMVYDLAAPGGPIPCFRYTEKCIRFDREDIEKYAASCRVEPVKKSRSLVPAGRAITLRTSDLNGESELRKLFRRDGFEPKQKVKAR